MSLPALPPSSGGGSSKSSTKPTHHLQVDLRGMPLDELLRLRGEIDKVLPVSNLADIDLNRELVLQMLATQRLQADVLDDDETPANQRAQVANSVQAALAGLVKLQSEVYTSERLKKIEQRLIEVMHTQPMELQVAFMGAYEEALRR